VNLFSLQGQPVDDIRKITVFLEVCILKGIQPQKCCTAQLLGTVTVNVKRVEYVLNFLWATPIFAPEMTIENLARLWDGSSVLVCKRSLGWINNDNYINIT